MARARQVMLRIVTALSAMIFIILVAVWSASYRTSTSPLAPSTLRMQSTLARRLPSLSFDQVGLPDVIDFLRDVSGSNICLNKSALKSAGIDENTLVTDHLNNVYFGDALVNIVAPISGMKVASDPKAVLISTAADLEPAQRKIWRHPAKPRNYNQADVALRHFHIGLHYRAALRDVLSDLQSTSKIEIDTDWDSLRKAGVRPETPAELDIRDVDTAQALLLLLWSLSANGDLQFETRADRVVVSSREHFDREEGFRIPDWITRLLPFLILALGAISAAIFWQSKSGKNWYSLRLIAPLAAFLIGATWSCSKLLLEYDARECVIGSWRWTVVADRGHLSGSLSPADPLLPYLQQKSRPLAQGSKSWGVNGLFLSWDGFPFRTWRLALPLWLLTVTAALLPIWSASIALRQFRRRKLHLCLQCGYDLRSSPGRCPECGAVVAGQVVA